MSQRTWAITLVAFLLAGSAVALATNVAGQDFERKGQMTSIGEAYNVDWESDESGKLRLMLDPVDGAASPSAQVSIFDGPRRLGTYTLDDDWPRLDQQVEPHQDPTLVVHRADGAEIEILAEEGHHVNLDRVDLVEETTLLADGANEAVRTQVALEIDRPVAHLGLALDGNAENLDVTALNENDEPVLEATAPAIDTQDGQALAPTFTPENVEYGSLLVRVSASLLNGTLSLETASLEDPYPHVVEASPSTSDTRPAGEDTNDTATDENQTEATTADQETTTSAPELLPILDLEPETPTAIDVPAGVDAIHVVGMDDCGQAVVFGPADDVVGVRALDSDEDARAWNGSDNADGNRTGDANHSHSRESDEVVVEVPVQSSGEHVLYLEDAHEAATVYLRVDDADAVDHRALEVKEVTGEIQGNESRLFSSQDGVANETLASGLLGFSWTSQGADVHREVRLVGPDGETMFESRGAGAAYMTVRDGSPGSDPLVGPGGEYTVETESNSVGPQGVEYTLYTYER